jgi:VWFA-related protein
MLGSAVLAASFLLSPAFSQITLRTDTRAVQVEVTVRDAAGRPVEDLTRDHFTLLDNGNQRPIQFFAFRRAGDDEAPAPLPANTFSNRGPAGSATVARSTAILLDGINGWADNFLLGRQGVLRLLDRLPSGERVAVYAITRFEGLVLLQDYTDNLERVRAGIQKYVAAGMQPAPPGMEDTKSAMMDPPVTLRQPSREREYMLRMGSEGVRMAFDALAQRLASVPGRKSVFWVTQGFPPTELRGMGQGDWDRTVAGLNQADVAVNTVDANGLGGPRRFWGPGAILTMQQVAERTGGTASYHRNDFGETMAEAIRAARSVYTLGFYLADHERDDRFHRLTVRADRPNLTLSYRQGYRPTGKRALGVDKKAGLESMLLSSGDVAGVGMTAAVDVADREIRIRLTLDLDSLSLQPVDDGWNGRFDDLFLQLDAAGKRIGRVGDTKQFHLPASALPKYERSGLPVQQTMRLQEGAAELAIMVRDSASGAAGLLRVPLDKLTRP